jgi:hypothetical protein
MKMPPITANTIQRLRQVFWSSLRTRLKNKVSYWPQVSPELVPRRPH